jgi:hypothetical protein
MTSRVRNGAGGAGLAGGAGGPIHAALRSTTARLETLWSEAFERSRAASPASPQQRQWSVALDRLVEALTEVEGFAARVDPRLGRRDWASRTPEGRI